VDVHVRSASYSCSATANVDRYQGYPAASAELSWSYLWEDAYISKEVFVLRVTSDRDSSRSADARIDRVDGAEGVDVNLKVGQRFV
jgi:hypothetical protein